MDVMISYAVQDRRIAVELVKFFQSKDINTWIDFVDKPPNQTYTDFANEAMSNADSMVVIYTPNLTSSKSVEIDFQKARANGKPIIIFKLIDIVPPDSIADYIKDCQVFNAFSYKWDQALQKLLEIVEKVI